MAGQFLSAPVGSADVAKSDSHTGTAITCASSNGQRAQIKP